MRYTVEFATSAAREFRALDRQMQRRISAKVSDLAEDPFPAGARKFQGEEDHWRICVGDYRVIYRVLKRRILIVIVRIGHRREVYR
jgi:mRNA interferase RelE/StbE